MGNRATSRCYSKWMLPAQIGGCACILLWPLGAVAGSLGIVALAAMGAGSALAGLAMADQESNRIAQGDRDALAQYLSDDDITEFKQLAQATATPPKTTGAVEAQDDPTTPTPTNTTQQPEPTSESEATAPSLLPIAPCQLDDAAPHLLLIGRTREGKSETLKHLIGSEERVWYITSKYTDQVPEHWTAYRVGGRDLPAQMAWILAKWEAQIDRHLSGQDVEREWFVVDEAVGIMQSLKTKGETKADRDQNTAIAGKLRALIIELVTAGAAVGAFVGLLSQTGNSGPLGVDLDLLKNFSVVSCGKRKKAQMISSFEKLTQLRLNSEQSAQALNLSGFWQLWENEGPTLSQVPLSTLNLAPVITAPINDYDAMRTPTPDNPDAVDWAGVVQELVNQPTEVLGLRVAAQNVTGKSLAKGGRAWVDWKRQLLEELRTLDPDLVDALRERYPDTPLG
jgi:hypothetical protein